MISALCSFTITNYYEHMEEPRLPRCEGKLAGPENSTQSNNVAVDVTLRTFFFYGEHFHSESNRGLLKL
jgi:hypothetical protein